MFNTLISFAKSSKILCFWKCTLTNKYFELNLFFTNSNSLITIYWLDNTRITFLYINKLYIEVILMHKKLVYTSITIIILMVLFSNYTTFAKQNIISIHHNNSNQVESEEKLQTDFILRLLSPYIDKAIKDYYGEIRQYGLWNAKIIYIKRLEPGSFNFETTVSVITFTGPHNPPYGLETITIRFGYDGVKVIKFKHEFE